MAVYALGFFGGDAPTEVLRERLQTTRTASSATTPPSHSPGAATPAASRHPPRDALHRRPRPGHRAARAAPRSRTRSRPSSSKPSRRSHPRCPAGSPELARSLRPEIESLTRSGLVSVRSQAQELLQNLQPSPDDTAVPRVRSAMTTSCHALDCTGRSRTLRRREAGPACTARARIGARCAVAVPVGSASAATLPTRRYRHKTTWSFKKSRQFRETVELPVIYWSGRLIVSLDRTVVDRIERTS